MRRLIALIVLVAVPAVVRLPVAADTTGFEDCYELEVTVPPYDPNASICRSAEELLAEAYARIEG